MEHENLTLILLLLPHFCVFQLPKTVISLFQYEFLLKQYSVFILVCLSTYQFPIAPVTDNHKLSILKEHPLIIMQFWVSEVLQG